MVANTTKLVSTVNTTMRHNIEYRVDDAVLQTTYGGISINFHVFYR